MTLHEKIYRQLRKIDHDWWVFVRIETPEQDLKGLLLRITDIHSALVGGMDQSGYRWVFTIADIVANKEIYDGRLVEIIPIIDLRP